MDMLTVIKERVNLSNNLSAGAFTGEGYQDSLILKNYSTLCSLILNLPTSR